MSQSQLHKARISVDKLYRLYEKTKRRIDTLQRQAIEQKVFLDAAANKLTELENKNAIS